MVKVKEVKIDGESIYIFDSVIYVFESSKGCTLELNLIVSEVVNKKYGREETLIVEIELEDSRLISSIMHVKVLSEKVPLMNLYCEVDCSAEFFNIPRVHEFDLDFPTLDTSITLEEIRKVEMPNEKISLKLDLPIDVVEWLRNQNSKELNQMLKEFIYTYWKQ